MGVVEQIGDNLKQAQKERNELLVGTLRVLRAEFMNLAISKMKKELTDEEAIPVIKTQVKKLKEAAEDFRRGNRSDLADKNQKEIEILSAYLPAEISEEEVRKEIEALVAGASYQPQDFGKAMGASMAKLKGKADGALVGKILKELLAK